MFDVYNVSICSNMIESEMDEWLKTTFKLMFEMPKHVLIPIE